MSHNKMLIDATHPEETRVVVLRQGRVEEFDYESAARKLLRGNIYLAKVTRVEPSLQAAFIDYGGNRHGFLAFNEIHPDYYQIPMADRQLLLDEEAAAEAAEEAEADAHAEQLARHEDDDLGDREAAAEEAEATAVGEAGLDAETGDRAMAEATAPLDEIAVEPIVTAVEPAEEAATEIFGNNSKEDSGEDGGEGGVTEVPTNGNDADPVEQVGSEDALEELPSRPRRRPRSYKIQEVIKRRQVILVQVVKEERGNKGAALTTYLSLAGRYTVLMPNTARGGGISRKITNPQDRKRLKAIAAELEVPEGMGLIIRTAGASRTKQEIKRDFEYLLRLWESVRELTLASTAPSLVYEEGNLIKRSIRDLYNKDVDEVIVAGDTAHKEAKEFMRMLMPSHAKNVVLYQEPEPLFTRFQIERQLNAMFSPYVTLKSGGYLVINQTEALVAIDVNSGKATREFSIEETALNTNMEAADEIARQLKLRDLAGLIVIDFIDMEEKRNNRAVERRLKDALRFDRARIQVGRISHFGLLEMSRQRLRSGVLEGSTSQCPHCQGTGIIRSTESVALAVLRGLEDTLMSGARTPIVATTTPTVALYILNNKRSFINEMETRHGQPILVQGSDKLQGANFLIEKGAAPAQPQHRPDRAAVNMDWGFEDEEEPGETEVERQELREGDSGEDGGRRRRRRRRRGERGDRPDRGDRQRSRGPRHEMEAGREVDDGDVAEELVQASDAGEEAEEARLEAQNGESGRSAAGAEGDEGHHRRRRRGRRGGRRSRGRERHAAHGGNGEQGAASSSADISDHGDQPEVDLEHFPGEDSAARVPREQARASAMARNDDTTFGGKEPSQSEPPPRRETASGQAEIEPVRPRRQPTASEPRLERVVVGPNPAEGAAAGAAEDQGENSKAPTRKGWWQRRFGDG